MAKGEQGPLCEKSPEGFPIRLLKRNHQRGGLTQGVKRRVPHPRGRLREAKGPVDRVVD